MTKDSFTTLKLADPKATVILLHENIWTSLLKDAWTFGCIFAMAWLNHEYAGGSVVVDGFALFALLLYGCGRTTGNHMTVAELREIFKEGE